MIKPFDPVHPSGAFQAVIHNTKEVANKRTLPTSNVLFRSVRGIGVTVAPSTCQHSKLVARKATFIGLIPVGKTTNPSVFFAIDCNPSVYLPREFLGTLDRSWERKPFRNLSSSHNNLKLHCIAPHRSAPHRSAPRRYQLSSGIRLGVVSLLPGLERQSHSKRASGNKSTMRPHNHAPPATLLALVFTTLTAANPYPRDELRDAGFGYLMNRACDSYCGTDNQYCCSSGQSCVTSIGIAACTGGSSGYDYYTTTWTETRTYTSTYSSYFPGATTPASGGTGGADCVPPAGSGQIACGPICCANWQYCSDSVNGQCMPNESAGSWSTGTTVGVVTTAFSAPYRVTSGSTIISTQTPGTAASATASATTTGTATPVTTTSTQLSGGAIAGIVVGTIAGVILLLLLCACCIIRGAWHTVMGILGFGKKEKKTERVEITEERYSRHGSAYGGRPAHRTWFGGGGRPSTAASRKEKKKSGSGLGWMAAAGGAALLLLGLRRGDKKKESSHKPPRSDWGSSYYTDSYTASSPSSLSSDRRTRDTRRSRQSRATRTSRRTSRHTRRS
ncbi:hypothetical protein BJ170DRAFT_597522 [Xylariales sp. AK1849]|nr:hypothetical protein BJ170DRAFT_597522 [Xylariales sp. AK1849]